MVWAQTLLLCALGMPLAFTSALGCTVMTDLKGTAAPARCLTPEGMPEVHHISQDPLHCSMASASVAQKIRELEIIIAIDPGKKPSSHTSRTWRSSSLMSVQGKNQHANCIYSMIFFFNANTVYESGKEVNAPKY